MTDRDDPARADPEGSAQPVCPRHADRVAYVRCQRCERPMCPDCQRSGAVGIHCVDCVNEAAKSAPRLRGVFGGRAAQGRPLVTYAIIGICVLVYLGQLASDRVTSALMYAPVLGGEEPWRLLTAAFVHAPASLRDPFSLLHIVMNMLALSFCGGYLEPLLGRARFLVLYLVSALGGSVAYATFAGFASSAGQWGSLWLTPTVGASGAVFGLFAAVVVLNRRLGRDTGSMLGLILINAAIPFFYPGIAWQAHLGGALIGAAVAGIIAAFGRDRASIQWASIAVLVLVLIVAATLIYQRVMGPSGTFLLPPGG